MTYFNTPKVVKDGYFNLYANIIKIYISYLTLSQRKFNIVAAVVLNFAS